MPLETRVAPVQHAGPPARRGANTNQPTVSHFFTRNANVRHGSARGQGKSGRFFNRFKDLGALFQADPAEEKVLKNKQIRKCVKVKCHECRDERRDRDSSRARRQRVRRRLPGSRPLESAKSACKPDSVGRPRERRGNHSSRPTVARRLKPPTRGLPEQDRRPPIWCCSA